MMLSGFMDMAVRIRTSTLRNLSWLSPVQIILMIIAAAIAIAISVLISKKKPEWETTKIKLITFGIAIVLFIPIIILL